MTNTSVWESQNQPPQQGMKRYLRELGIDSESALADLIDNSKDAQLPREGRTFPNEASIAVLNKDFKPGKAGEPVHALLISDPGKGLTPAEALGHLLTFCNGQTEDPDRYSEGSQGTYGAGAKQSTIALADEVCFLFSPLGDDNVYRGFNKNGALGNQRVVVADKKHASLYMREMKYDRFYGKKVKVEDVSGFVILLKKLRKASDFPIDCCKKLRLKIKKMPKLKRLYSKRRDFTIRLKGRPAGGQIKHEDPMKRDLKGRIAFLTKDRELRLNGAVISMTAVYDRKRPASDASIKFVICKDSRYFGEISGNNTIYGNGKPYQSSELYYSKIEFDLVGNRNNEYFGINPTKNDPRFRDGIEKWILETPEIKEILDQIKKINQDFSATKTSESDAAATKRLWEVIKDSDKVLRDKEDEDCVEGGEEVKDPPADIEEEEESEGEDSSETNSVEEEEEEKTSSPRKPRRKDKCLELPFRVESYEGKKESSDCFKHKMEQIDVDGQSMSRMVIQLNLHHKWHQMCLKDISSGKTDHEKRGEERKDVLVLQIYNEVYQFVNNEIEEEQYEKQQIRIGNRFWRRAKQVGK